MPNLNDLIASWRSTLTDLSEQQLDELEDHLREQAAALQRQGLSDAEAFTVASMRSELARGFAQDDPARAWSQRLRWMVIGFVLCGIVNWLIMRANTVFGFALVKQGFGLPTTTALRIFFLTALIAAMVAIWNRWWSSRQDVLLIRPRAWLTSAWTMSLAIAVLPLLYGLGQRVMGVLLPAGDFTADEIRRLALSGTYTELVLPFTAPLVLLIIAINLSKRVRRPA